MIGLSQRLSYFSAPFAVGPVDLPFGISLVILMLVFLVGSDVARFWLAVAAAAAVAGSAIVSASPPRYYESTIACENLMNGMRGGPRVRPSASLGSLPTRSPLTRCNLGSPEPASSTYVQTRTRCSLTFRAFTDNTIGRYRKYFFGITKVLDLD